MVADARIYDMIRPPQPLPNPMAQAGQVMQLRQLMGQGQLQDLQRGELERGIAEKGKLRDLFARGNVKPEEVMAIDPETGLKFQKSAAEAQSASANLLAQDDKLIKSFAERGREELMSVRPEQWVQYRQLQMERASMLSTPQYKQVALQALQKMPEQYDQPWVQAQLAAGTPAPAGHTRMPGGGLSPVDPNYLAGEQAKGAPQRALTTAAQQETARHNLATEAAAAGSATREALAKINTQENLMRDDFTNASKEFVKVRDAHQRVMASAKDPSAAGDLALIFNYMKVLDPGSTVREGEFANAQNSGGMDQRTIALYNNVLRGERLSPDVRNDFLSRSGRLYEAAVGNQETIEQDYTQKAERAKARPEQVVTKYRTKGDAPSQDERKVIQGKTYIKRNGQWFEERQ